MDIGLSNMNFTTVLRFAPSSNTDSRPSGVITVTVVLKARHQTSTIKSKPSQTNTISNS